MLVVEGTFCTIPTVGIRRGGSFLFPLAPYSGEAVELLKANFQINVELELNTSETDCNSYAKTSPGKIRTSCLKYAHTIFSYIGISMLYLGSYQHLYVKNDAASNTN